MVHVIPSINGHLYWLQIVTLLSRIVLVHLFTVFTSSLHQTFSFPAFTFKRPSCLKLYNSFGHILPVEILFFHKCQQADETYRQQEHFSHLKKSTTAFHSQ